MVGCSFKDMDNTPTKQVENYLNNYQTLDDTVLESLDNIVNGEELFNNDQKDSYREILKKHYQDLTYTIKDETVNGDKATVEVEIEVKDYTKNLKQAEIDRTQKESEFLDDTGMFDESKFIDYKLDMIKSAEEKVKYTLYFSLNKVDDEWKINPLTQTEQEKLLGIYEY